MLCSVNTSTHAAESARSLSLSSRSRALSSRSLAFALCKRWLIKARLVSQPPLVYISPSTERSSLCHSHFPRLCAGNCSALLALSCALPLSPCFIRARSLPRLRAPPRAAVRSIFWARVHSDFGSEIHLAAELARVKSSDALPAPVPGQQPALPWLALLGLAMAWLAQLYSYTVNP